MINDHNDSHMIMMMIMIVTVIVSTYDIFKKVTEAEFQTIGPLYMHSVWYLPFTNSPRKHTMILSHIILATYRRFTVESSDSHKMSVAIFTPTPYINKWQMSLCNNSSDNKSYWIHRVDVKVSAQVTTVTYMHQSQPSSHLLLINFLVHLELWPGNHLIWCNAT